jgi:hypothetical protein
VAEPELAPRCRKGRCFAHGVRCGIGRAWLWGARETEVFVVRVAAAVQRGLVVHQGRLREEGAFREGTPRAHK